MKYRIVPPTRVGGIKIARTVPPVFIIVDSSGKRADSFLYAANARAELKRLNQGAKP